MRKEQRIIETNIKKTHVSKAKLESEYADMAKDKKCEKEALEWIEGVFRETS
jgi:hypothetical protein